MSRTVVAAIPLRAKSSAAPSRMSSRRVETRGATRPRAPVTVGETLAISRSPYQSNAWYEGGPAAVDQHLARLVHDPEQHHRVAVLVAPDPGAVPHLGDQGVAVVPRGGEAPRERPHPHRVAAEERVHDGPAREPERVLAHEDRLLVAV